MSTQEANQDNDEDEYELIHVVLPSGATFDVLTDDEADFIEQLTEQYLTSFKFQHPSDLLDLDRLVTMEMLSWRWQRWMSRLSAYGPAVQGSRLHRDLPGDAKQLSTEIRQLKKAMGVDKAARDRAHGEDSVPYYLERLRQCAMVFGIHRNHQADRALELINQMIGMATFWKNAPERERRLMHLTAEEIVMWVLDTLAPEFQEIDRHFRETEQQFWVREL